MLAMTSLWKRGYMVVEELERTSGSSGGELAVAVSGYMAKGAGENVLPAPKLQTRGGWWLFT